MGHLAVFGGSVVLQPTATTALDKGNDTVDHTYDDDWHHDEIALPDVPPGGERGEGVDCRGDERVDAAKDKGGKAETRGFTCGSCHGIPLMERSVSLGAYLNDSSRYVKDRSCHPHLHQPKP